MLPSEQVKLFGPVVSQLPLEGITALRRKPTGQVSVTTVRIAVVGPWLVIVIV